MAHPLRSTPATPYYALHYSACRRRHSAHNSVTTRRAHHRDAEERRGLPRRTYAWRGGQTRAAGQTPQQAGLSGGSTSPLFHQYRRMSWIAAWTRQQGSGQIGGSGRRACWTGGEMAALYARKEAATRKKRRAAGAAQRADAAGEQRRRTKLQRRQAQGDSHDRDGQALIWNIDMAVAA